MNSNFTIKIIGTVAGITDSGKGGSRLKLQVQPSKAIRFDRADERPADVLVDVPGHIGVNGIGFGDELTVEGEAAVASREVEDKNSYGKPTGRTYDRYAYYFQATKVERPKGKA